MKLRLIGSADLVRAWGKRLDDVFGIQGKEYPSRYGAGELRLYFDIDDRLAAEIVEKREARRGTRQQEKEAAKWLTTPDKT